MARKKTETAPEAVESKPLPVEEDIFGVEEDFAPEAAPEAPAEQPKEESYSKAEVDALIASAVAKAVADALRSVNQQRVNAIPERERVNLLWQAPVMPENVEEFGPNGRYARITGPTGAFWVPNDEFSLIVDSRVRTYLERRWLIVLSGLSDEEREIYGVKYRPGEYLDKAAFSKIAEQGEKLLDIYPKLCAGNRKIVAGAVYEGWRGGNKAIKRGLVEKLAAMCREVDPEESTFQTILQEMAEKAARGK